MKKGLILIYCLLSCFSVYASENPLMGKWKMSGQNGVMVVHFEADKMTMSTSEDIKENAQTVSVRYQELDKSWGVEILSEKGEMQGTMMAIPKGENEIKFGAPGSAFFVLKKM
ncbi:hypothetical protein FE810_01435 [Thalassotalea litorea]|uniref:DUF2147 domain-containing protein n=1 Tax=Thalassotalea litorea TaxID=2020715 RepID=A0A5R9IWT0_9GAMM|nr:hypothetical protein [Thalassotalea litorea]TLU67636.1 hypothetical protein FE810_01435 [Thalassotalea litorea]